MKQLLKLYGDVEAFLRTHEDLAPATRTTFLRYLDVPQKKICKELELAVTFDAGLPFVQATYKLEGDGPLALQCYEVVASLTAAVNMAQRHYPKICWLSQGSYVGVMCNYSSRCYNMLYPMYTWSVVSQGVSQWMYAGSSRCV